MYFKSILICCMLPLMFPSPRMTTSSLGGAVTFCCNKLGRKCPAKEFELM